MLEVAGHRLGHYRVGHGDLSDGCAALAMAVYILSRETGAAAQDVGADDVRDLMTARSTRDPAGTSGELPQMWGARLQALGHDLEAADDPVTALWRHLRTERQTDALDDRREPALVAGLDVVLGPIYGVRF